MDRLAYNYTGGTNRLDYVHDTVPSANYTEDIDAHLSGNYTYDKIGNLKTDVKEGITAINWTVYGKISSIVKSGGTISYTYDAAGNRITKTASGITTIYVRDASGNVMSVYEKQGLQPAKQDEVHLYGSSRLGILGALTYAPTDVPLGADEGKMWTLTRGEKFFELSNHLGNVLVTVSDKKVPINDGARVEYYVPDLKSASDYYPFGMQMVGRKWRAGDYRYRFNGKEMDNEISGEANQYDYGFRIYNPRLGRFLSVDPLQKKYPELTPYQFSHNAPIDGVDLDGRERYDMRLLKNEDGSTKLELISTGPTSSDIHHLSGKSLKFYLT
jgi:RHS repeat-associated protein